MKRLFLFNCLEMHMNELIYFIPLLFVFLFATVTSNGQSKGINPYKLAQTPPMGWNSWNLFACDINEDLIKGIADAMVESGMKDAGYEYIVIDDCWQIDRDELGNIIPDPERFPSGMKALGDYIHSKGLKFGIYSDAGIMTCQKRPGSRGYEFQDARTYAEWGVDYLKYDWCHHGTQDARASYEIMGTALRKTGRPIVYSICEWGTNQPWKWAKEVGGNLWRTTEDILNCWDCRTDWGGMGFVWILDSQDSLAKYAEPGHWNDPDMLEVGNNGLTVPESRAHFSLWAILAAPLMAGNDIRNMSPEIKEILTNKEVIAVDQDRLGKQGRKIKDDGDLEVWAKELSDGSRAVVFFNRGKTKAKMSITWKELGLNKNANYIVRDLWQHQNVTGTDAGYSATVSPHDVVMIKVSK